jgi:hypothetical protein
MVTERIQQAIDVAHRAEGFAEYLSEKGLIGKGDEVREAVASLLALEIAVFPDCVVSARIEVADALAVLLNTHSYDSGKRRYATTQGGQSWAKI